MSQVPIFDSLAHPTIDGNWLRPRYAGLNHIEQYLGEMTSHGVRWAFCVGMEGVGGYSEESYSPFVRAAGSKLIPIAYYSFESPDESAAQVRKKLSAIRDMSYAGVKIHPRFSRLALDSPAIREVVRIAGELGLLVLLCTHFYGAGDHACRSDLGQVSKLLSELNDPRVVLMHGGTVRLLEALEIVRPYSNCLLDLSYTLCKYEGSSIDLDLRYAFRTLDQRICIGSDSPEYGTKDLRRRFEEFSKGLPDEKRENIAFRNLLRFCGMAEED